MLDRELAPLKQQIQQYQQRDMQQEYEVRGEIQQTISEFADTHDYYSELQGEMADFLELAANRGQSMTMDQAYSYAIAAHPEYAQAPQQRAQHVDKVRNASLSVSGSPQDNNQGIPHGQPTGSLRDQLNAAFIAREGGRI